MAKPEFNTIVTVPIIIYLYPSENYYKQVRPHSNWFGHGWRVVFVISEEPIALNEVEFFDWKRMYQKYE